MPDTPIYGIPYQGLNDEPDGAALGQGIAEAVEDELERIDAAVAAVTTPPAVQHEVPASFTATNTSYAVTSETESCGVAFVAPPSGRVMVHWAAGLDVAQPTNSVVHQAFVIRTGDAVGSGGSVLAAADDRSLRVSRSILGDNTGGVRSQFGMSYLVSGLTAGSDYNVRLEHRVTSGSGFIFRRMVQVVPAP